MWLNFLLSETPPIVNVKMASSPVSQVSSQELDAEELNVTSAVLTGAAHHYGNYCKTQNEAFMDCRIESKDPRKCLKEGKEITKCALDFFRKIKGSCNEAFTEHWTCLDYNNQEYTSCRKTQKVFDVCMSEKLDTKRDS